MNLIDELLDKIDVKNLRTVILSLSILTFIISLTQECYCTISECDDSIMAFLLGFFGILSGVVSWFANPALFYSWIHIKNNKKSTRFSLLALFLAGIFLIYRKVGFGEARHINEIISYGLGYWLWLFSIGIIFFGNLLIGRKLKNDYK